MYNEIYHYGVKGMKWGKRKAPETSTGIKIKRTSNDEKHGENAKTKHRLKLESKYKDKGYSEEDSVLLADRRIKTEKILAVTAGVTLAAATAYVVSKQIKYRADPIIKKGTMIQRIAETTDTKIKEGMYTSYNKKDNIKYGGKLAYGRQNADGVVKKMNIKVTKNIKIASRKHAEDTFIDLFKNNKEFQKNVSDTIKTVSILEPKASDKDIITKMVNNPNDMTAKQIRKMYDSFNIGLGMKSEEATKSSQTFYKELAKKGYNAVKDINDMDYSGFKTKTPTILFNAKDKLKVDSIETLDSKTINDNFKGARQILKKQEDTEKTISNLKKYIPAAGMAVTTTNATSYLNTRAIENYRREHRNSNLTDKEILKIVSNKNKK